VADVPMCSANSGPSKTAGLNSLARLLGQEFPRWWSHLAAETRCDRLLLSGCQRGASMMSDRERVPDRQARVRSHTRTVPMLLVTAMTLSRGETQSLLPRPPPVTGGLPSHTSRLWW
jgi:hypothetical protein